MVKYTITEYMYRKWNSKTQNNNTLTAKRQKMAIQYFFIVICQDLLRKEN